MPHIAEPHFLCEGHLHPPSHQVGNLLAIWDFSLPHFLQLVNTPFLQLVNTPTLLQIILESIPSSSSLPLPMLAELSLHPL